MEVLLVDDDAAFRAAFRRMLSGATDVHLRDVGSAEQAALEIARLPPDLAFVDLRLGEAVDDASGLDVIAKVHAHNHAAKALVVTGTTSPDVVRDALRAGADDLLFKTELTPTELERIVGAAAERPALETTLRGEVERRQRAESTMRGMQEQLRRAQRAEEIGRLASGIAHDFNNLLSVVISLTELTLAETTTVAQREDLEEVLAAARRGAGLARRLFAFSREEVLYPRELDLNLAVHDAEQTLQKTLPADVKIALALTADLGTIRVDPAQLEQIISNLLVNARESVSGGGTITMATTNVRLSDDRAGTDVDLPPGRYVVLAIRASGTGIVEHTRAHIFEPFFTTKQGGTGLGLATVHGLLKRSGGAIELASEPGRGMTLKAYFPRVVDARNKVLSGRLPAASVEHDEPTILLTEDEPAVRRALTLILSKAGYAVLEATSVEEGLAVFGAATKPVDLLVTDLVLDDGHGVELAQRASELSPGLRVLFMSGYTEDAIDHHGLPPGVHFVQKPISADTLVTSVREALAAPPFRSPQRPG